MLTKKASLRYGAWTLSAFALAAIVVASVLWVLPHYYPKLGSYIIGALFLYLTGACIFVLYHLHQFTRVPETEEESRQAELDELRKTLERRDPGALADALACIERYRRQALERAAREEQYLQSYVGAVTNSK